MPSEPFAQPASSSNWLALAESCGYSAWSEGSSSMTEVRGATAFLPMPWYSADTSASRSTAYRIACRTLMSSVGGWVVVSIIMNGAPTHGLLATCSPAAWRRCRSWGVKTVAIWVSPDSTVAARVPPSGMNFQTTLSRYPGPSWSDQGARRLYPSQREMVMWSFGTHSSILYGPVMTGVWLTWSPCFCVAVGESMGKYGLPAYSRNGTNGSLKRTRTV